VSAQHAQRSKNFLSIVLIFATIASVVGCVMFLAEWILTGLSNPQYYVSLDGLLSTIWQAIVATFVLGVPCALITGLFFALMVEFAGLHQMVFALVAAMLTLALAHLLPAFGGPIWHWEAFLSLHVLVYLVVPTIMAWLVLRYWTARFQ
jgi:hypothetical protein